MIIAVDAMGGDHAPKVVVEGAILAASELQDKASIVLVGDESQIIDLLPSNQSISIAHASETIDMHEHPAKAFASKPNSSIGVGFQLLKAGKADAFCSAGNTGAMMVGSLFSLKTYAGIQRPPIAGFFPLKKGSFGLMLDIGANAECKPEMLNQFAELGSIYAKHTLNRETPKVALLNIGEEEQKGTATIQAAHQLLKKNDKINFIGNVESREMFEGVADVIVTEGFTGNVIFKMGEALYEHANSVGIDDPMINKMNYEVVGGSPIIGVKGNVIVAHGISSSIAIKNMILLAYRQANSRVSEKLEAYFSQEPS